MKKIIFFHFIFLATLSAQVINIQGRLTNKDNIPLEGTHDFKVIFYDSDNNTILSNEITDVEVKDGFYSLEIPLGFILPGKDIWVEIGVKKKKDTTYEFFPKYKLAYSPYAIRSKYADFSGGIVSTASISLGGLGGIFDVSTITVNFIFISTITTYNPTLNISTNVYVKGNLSATKFIGDGSGLYNVFATTAQFAYNAAKSTSLASGNYLNDVKVSSAIYADVAGTALSTTFGLYTATATLNMNNYGIINISSIQVSGVSFFKVIESSVVFLLYHDETPSSETTNTTNEITLKSWTLPANNYDFIIVESEVRERNSTNSAYSFEWKVVVGTTTVKTINSGIRSGDNKSEYQIVTLKCVVKQKEQATISIRGKMGAANSDVGIMAYSLRVYGVKKMKLLYAD